MSSSYTMTWPNAYGSNTQVLTTDGSGALSWSAAGGGGNGWTQSGGSTSTTFLTSGSSWAVPSDWNSSNNTIEVIGGGGGGGRKDGSASEASGGGGGAYSKITNLSLTPSASVSIQVGAGGAGGSGVGDPGGNGTDTYFCNSTSNCASIAGTAVQAGAKGGIGGDAVGGAGGAASSGVGTTKYNGGSGANALNNAYSGAGGGGAAGPNGAGGNGASNGTTEGFFNPADKGSDVTLSNVNKTATFGSGTNSLVRSDVSKSSGKWYWEVTQNTVGSFSSIVGIANSSATLNNYLAFDANGYGYYGQTGNKLNSGANSYGSTFTAGDIIGIAMDLDADTLTFYKNNTSQGTAFTGLTGTYFAAVSSSTGGAGESVTANFGATAFTYTPPSGFAGLYAISGSASNGGGGGGGNGGGSVGTGGGSDGGAGGNNSAATGGGAGGSGSTAGVTGTAGGGGGGGDGNTGGTGSGTTPGNGGAGTEWDATHGSGGGAGGAGASDGGGASRAVGGTGGLYGGGGGGGAYSNTLGGSLAGGPGGQGIIVITYTPTPPIHLSTATDFVAIGTTTAVGKLTLEGGGISIGGIAQVGRQNNRVPLGNTLSSVDTGGDMGSYTSLTIGPDGLPVISYSDTTTGNLKVTKCNDVVCTGADETRSTVDSGGSGYQYTSITIGTDGFPVISYYVAGSLDLKVAKCGNAACSSGNTLTTVDSTGNVGAHASISIASDGFPVVSYYDIDNSALKVAKCGNAACSSGNTLTTVDSGARGFYTSITVSNDGLPVISSVDGNDGHLRVAKCGNAACSSGNTLTTVDSTSGTISRTSIAISNDGLPVISYYDVTNGDLRVAKCGNAACSSGDTITIVDSTGDIGFYPSIAIGADGLPVISYYDVTNGDLKVAHCGNQYCQPYWTRR